MYRTWYCRLLPFLSRSNKSSLTKTLYTTSADCTNADRRPIHTETLISVTSSGLATFCSAAVCVPLVVPLRCTVVLLKVPTLWYIPLNIDAIPKANAQKFVQEYGEEEDSQSGLMSRTVGMHPLSSSSSLSSSAGCRIQILDLSPLVINFLLFFSFDLQVSASLSEPVQPRQRTGRELHKKIQTFFFNFLLSKTHRYINFKIKHDPPVSATVWGCILNWIMFSEHTVTLIQLLYGSEQACASQVVRSSRQ